MGINHRLIMKPMVKKDLFARESAFYKQTQENKHDTNSPIRFVPKFLGLLYCGTCNVENAKALEISESAKPVPLPHIVLEDLTHGYDDPNVIDIKMGTCTFEPTATQQKKDSEVRKYPFQAELGFRITGFKLLDQSSGSYLKAGKPFGRSVQPQEVTAALAMLFRAGNGYRCDVIRAFIVHLENILLWMRSQTSYKFFCSSILLVYDAHTESFDGVVTPVAECSTPKVPTGNKADYSSLPDLSAENSPEVMRAIQSHLEAVPEAPPLLRVKMIDFAHVVVNKRGDNCRPDPTSVTSTAAESPEVERGGAEEGKGESPLDDGYIHGLQSLIQHLHGVLREVQRGDTSSSECIQTRVNTMVQRVHTLAA